MDYSVILGCWDSVNDVRGAIDGWEFKQYVPGLNQQYLTKKQSVFQTIAAFFREV